MNIKKDFMQLFKGCSEQDLKKITPIIERMAFIVETLEKLEKSIKKDGTKLEVKGIIKEHPDLKSHTALTKNLALLTKTLNEFAPNVNASDRLSEFLDE